MYVGVCVCVCINCVYLFFSLNVWVLLPFDGEMYIYSNADKNGQGVGGHFYCIFADVLRSWMTPLRDGTNHARFPQK